MNLNMTLFGEMITFALFVWVTMRYVWPPINKAMQEREKKIADGIEAAEKGKKSLELAERRSIEQLRKAKDAAAGIVDQANQRGETMIETAKVDAHEAGKKMLELAKADIVNETDKAKHELESQVASLVVAATEKVLQQSIDMKADHALIDKVIAEI